MPSYVTHQPLDDRSYIAQELQAIRHRSASDMPMIERLRRVVPFDNFSVTGLDIEGCQLGKGVYLATNLPDELTKAYTNERLIEVEPMVGQVSADTSMAFWEAVSAADMKAPGARRIADLMTTYDVSPRTSFTLWTRGRIYGAATYSRRRPFTDDELTTLMMFSPVVHQALAKPIIQAVNRRLGLIKGEILCLKLAAQGLTTEEIASDTPYKFETVTTYLKSATKKLNARNRTHALAEAFRRKIIE